MLTGGQTSGTLRYDELSETDSSASLTRCFYFNLDAGHFVVKKVHQIPLTREALCKGDGARRYRVKIGGRSKG